MRTEGEPDSAAPARTATYQAPNTDNYAPPPGDDTETTASVPPRRSAGRSSKKKSDEPLKPYSPEWWAREKEVDDRLKKSMIICNGC